MPDMYDPSSRPISGSLKSWSMAIFILGFVILYTLSLTNVITMPEAVKNLHPVVFVIIGYYLGRLPSAQNENVLKGELLRQAQRADAAQHAKEHAFQARDVIEEKIKNVRTILGTMKIDPQRPAPGDDRSNLTTVAAMSILDS
jgi:hypothetical protein